MIISSGFKKISLLSAFLIGFCCQQVTANQFSDYLRDTAAIAWGAVKNSKATGAFSASSPWTVDTILSHVEPGNVLEVGAGPGTITIPLIEQLLVQDNVGWRLDVVEMQDDLYVKLAQRVQALVQREGCLPIHLYNQDFAVWLPNDIECADGFYNTVVCTIPFVRLPYAAMDMILEKIHRLLKPGGVFIYVSLAGARAIGKFAACLHEWYMRDSFSVKSLEYKNKLACLDQWIADGFDRREVIVWRNFTPIRVYWAIKKQ